MTDTKAFDNVRVECAFGTDMFDPLPAWQDITAYADLETGINITHGRQDEFGQPQAGQCTLTLNNTDGRFTVGNTSSPYYPNVQIRKRLRVTYLDPTIAGNLIDAESASFEGGTVGDWVPAGSTVPALANSTTHAEHGTKAMRITWATSGANVQKAQINVPLVIGRQYTFKCRVWVTAGTPNVRLRVQQGGALESAVSSGTGAFVSVSITFTATHHQGQITLDNNSAATSGQQCWVDSFQADEGASVPTFTTTALPIRYRHTGYVDEWPVDWPNGGKYTEAQITSIDRFKPLGNAKPLRSVIEEEYHLDNPAVYFVLSEAGGTTVGDTSGAGIGTLAISNVGNGNGTLVLGENTGPGTDGHSAPAFTPQDGSNGKCLAGPCNPIGGATGYTLEAAFVASDQAFSQVFVRLRTEDYGPWTEMYVASNGVLSAVNQNESEVADFAFGGGAAVDDGLVHHAALTASISGSTITLTLYRDGVSVGTDTYTGTETEIYDVMSIGGGSNFNSKFVFNGTVAHVAAYNEPLSATRILAHANACRTGFEGERSDERIARLASYGGVTTDEMLLDTGLSTSIAHFDITGQTPLGAMQTVAETEDGVLFVNGEGLLEFHSREHRYNASSVLTISAQDDAMPNLRFVANDSYLLNDVTASRENGITYRALNQTSIDKVGWNGTDLSLVTTSDNEVMDAANWRTLQHADVTARCPNLGVNILTSPLLVATVLTLEVGDLITLNALASSAPATSVTLFLEGWSENISKRGWEIMFNTSPSSGSTVWKLDSSTYSVLGTSTRLGY